MKVIKLYTFDLLTLDTEAHMMAFTPSAHKSSDLN